MEIEYKGANCVVLSTKNETVIIDPKLSLVGLKDMTIKSGVVVATQHDFAVPTENTLLVDGPGEYETMNVAIKGIAAERMIDHDKSKQATMYRIDMGDVVVAVIGHVASPLTEAQFEELGVVDIVIVPAWPRRSEKP